MKATITKTVRQNRAAAGLLLSLLAGSSLALADQTNPLDAGYYKSRSGAQHFVGTSAAESASQPDDGNPLRATYGWQHARPAFIGIPVTVVGGTNNPLSPQYRFR